MKSVGKILGIILLIAACSAALALMGVMIGSGAASKLLGLPSSAGTKEQKVSGGNDQVQADADDNEPVLAQTEPAEPATEKPEKSASAFVPVRETGPIEGVILVGDSRTVGMQRAMASYEDNFIYIGESGEGYDWFIRSGLEQMENAIRTYPTWPVVLNLGVNDTSAVMNYITLYQSFAGRYPNTLFYYLSVNPLTEESTVVVDAQVVVFNQYLKMAFPDAYLDSYSMLKKEGFESADGVHYSDDTYRRIHEFILDELEKLLH